MKSIADVLTTADVHEYRDAGTDRIVKSVTGAMWSPSQAS